MTQKLIIPRGLIDPEETTVINVPNALRGSSVVIAKKGQGSPGASGQGYTSFYTPPPRGMEHPSLDYPAFTDFESPDLPSFYRIGEGGENWNKSWGPMPPRAKKSPTATPPARREGEPELPIDYWSPTMRSTPSYRQGYTGMDLKVPRRNLFSEGASPIVQRQTTMSSTIQPATRDWPLTINDPSELMRALNEESEQVDSDVEEEEIEAEEEEEERLHALDQLEFVENDTIIQDLLAMQRERRKVVYDLANMAPTRKSSLKKLLAPLKALKKFKAKLKKKNKVGPMPQ